MLRRQWGYYLGNPFFDVHTNNDWVLLVEDHLGDDAQDAGEHRIKLGSFLLLILHLQGGSIHISLLRRASMVG